MKRNITAWLLLVCTSLLLVVGCEVETASAPDTGRPEANITYPGNWAHIYSETLDIYWSVIDRSELDSIAVFVNGALVDTPQEDNGSVMINQNDYPEGLNTVYVYASDVHGNESTSELVNFYWVQEEEESDIRCTIVRPVVWEKVFGGELDVKLNVESLLPVEDVELFIDGAAVYEFNEEPYEISLNLDTAGTHNIYAKVTDINGFTQTSELINFEVYFADTENPVGYIAYPADWADITGEFEVRINAFDNIGVERVELFLDGEYHGETTIAPFNFNVNSTTMANQNHTVYAVIYDEAGNSSSTQMINFRVEN